MPDLHLISPQERNTYRGANPGDTIETPGFRMLGKRWDRHHITEAAKDYILTSKHFQAWYKTLLTKLEDPRPIP